MRHSEPRETNPDRPSLASEPFANLEIHVLSGGKGESIVVRLPDTQEGEQRWGVVDCYAASPHNPDTNYTLQFLRSRGVKKLEFLCLTHPHDDHYRGMSQLFELEVLRFWQFSFAMNIGRLVNLLRQSARDPEEEENAEDLDRTLELVHDRRARIKKKFLTANKHLYPIPQAASLDADAPDLRIQSVGPSEDHVAAYNRLTEEWFAAGRYMTENRPPHLDHNAISGALLISYGDTRLILGGDAEKTNWQATLDRYGATDLCANAVKVSQHGAPTGYCDKLWGIFCGAGQPYAIITPHKRYDLPRLSAVQHIKDHVEAGGEPRIMTTCLPAIGFPTWDDSPKESARIWNAQPFRIPIDTPPEAELLIMTAFYGFEGTIQDGGTVENETISDGLPDDIGRCSLRFDARGNCDKIGFKPPAGWLTLNDT